MQGDTSYHWDRISIQDRLFGNRDFLINCLNYLVDDNGIMELRSRELKLRFLNKSKIKAEKFNGSLLIFWTVFIVIFRD